MIVADIKARRPHRLPHRMMAVGERLCRMQFASEEDCRFFANHLRWSAFGVDCVTDNDPAPTAAAPEAAPAPKPIEPTAAAPEAAPAKSERPKAKR